MVGEAWRQKFVIWQWMRRPARLGLTARVPGSRWTADNWLLQVGGQQLSIIFLGRGLCSIILSFVRKFAIRTSDSGLGTLNSGFSIDCLDWLVLTCIKLEIVFAWLVISGSCRVLIPSWRGRFSPKLIQVYLPNWHPEKSNQFATILSLEEDLRCVRRLCPQQNCICSTSCQCRACHTGGW